MGFKVHFCNSKLTIAKDVLNCAKAGGSVAALEGCWKTCLLSNSSAVLLVWHFVLLFLSSCVCIVFERNCSGCPGTSGDAPSHSEVNSKLISLGM